MKMTSQQHAFLDRLDWKLYKATFEENSIGYDISFVTYQISKLSLIDKIRSRWNFLDITFSVIEIADAIVESE